MRIVLVVASGCVVFRFVMVIVWSKDAYGSVEGVRGSSPVNR